MHAVSCSLLINGDSGNATSVHTRPPPPTCAPFQGISPSPRSSAACCSALRWSLQERPSTNSSCVGSSTFEKGRRFAVAVVPGAG